MSSNFLFLKNYTIAQGNIASTALAEVLCGEEDVPLLCGIVEVDPGTDHTATVSVSITFSTRTFVIPTITLTAFQSIPFVFPCVEGDTSPNISYSVNVTGTNGSYYLYFKVK